MEKLIKQFKKYWFFFGLLLLSLTIVGIDSWTKYVTEKKEDGIVKAVEMFFTSDVLKESGTGSQSHDYTIVDWKDGSEITFELRNYPDSKRFTNREVKYNLTSDAEGTFKIIDPITELTIGSNSGELPRSSGASDQKKHKVEFTLNDINAFFGEETERIVTITATTTEPYANYQLSAKFLIKKAVEENYYVIIEDGPDSPYTTVTINANVAQNLTLIWDDNAVVPDQTNSIFKTNIGSDSTAFENKDGKTIGLNTIAVGGSVTFLMLKYDSTVYSADTYTNAFVISPSP